MKKLLLALSGLGIVSSGGSVVVACSGDEESNKIDLSDIIVVGGFLNPDGKPFSEIWDKESFGISVDKNSLIEAAFIKNSDVITEVAGINSWQELASNVTVLINSDNKTGIMKAKDNSDKLIGSVQIEWEASEYVAPGVDTIKGELFNENRKFIPVNLKKDEQANDEKVIEAIKNWFTKETFIGQDKEKWFDITVELNPDEETQEKELPTKKANVLIDNTGKNGTQTKKYSATEANFEVEYLFQENLFGVVNKINSDLETGKLEKPSFNDLEEIKNFLDTNGVLSESLKEISNESVFINDDNKFAISLEPGDDEYYYLEDENGAKIESIDLVFDGKINSQLLKIDTKLDNLDFKDEETITKETIAELVKNQISTNAENEKIFALFKFDEFNLGFSTKDENGLIINCSFKLRSNSDDSKIEFLDNFSSSFTFDNKFNSNLNKGIELIDGSDVIDSSKFSGSQNTFLKTIIDVDKIGDDAGDAVNRVVLQKLLESISKFAIEEEQINFNSFTNDRDQKLISIKLNTNHDILSDETITISYTTN